MSERSCLVGFSGFVGKHLLEQHNFDELYRSTNISGIENKEFDVLVCAGVPAVKWLANNHPEEDRTILQELFGFLATVKVKKSFILVSTIDVYPDPSSASNEDGHCNLLPNHAYGSNRLWFENQIKSTFGHKCTIIRLPALFGKHMKKNYIFDLLHNRHEFIGKINLNSSFQWYNVSRLWSDIELLLKNGVTLANLFTEPLSTRDIVECCFPQHLESIKPPSNAGSKYDLRTKHAILWGQPGEYIQSADVVLSDMKLFVQDYASLEFRSPRLCISNIAWGEQDAHAITQILAMQNVTKLEVAPTKIFESWSDIVDDAKVTRARRDFEQHGLSVVSLQSILFNKENLELFGSDKSRDDLLVHTKKVIDLASALGARVIVWGSPKQRKTHGRPYDDCFQLATKWFRLAGSYANERNVVIGIEANARDYGCDFCYTTPQAALLVRSVDCPGVKLHLDTANLHMEGDDLVSCLRDNADILCHVQISEPYLCNFEKPAVQHELMALALCDVAYTGLISIEMRDNGNCVRAVAQALNYVKKVYRTVLC